VDNERAAFPPANRVEQTIEGRALGFAVSERVLPDHGARRRYCALGAEGASGGRFSIASAAVKR
jgi:hypothetical protein